MGVFIGSGCRVIAFTLLISLCSFTANGQVEPNTCQLYTATAPIKLNNPSKPVGVLTQVNAKNSATTLWNPLEDGNGVAVDCNVTICFDQFTDPTNTTISCNLFPNKGGDEMDLILLDAFMSDNREETECFCSIPSIAGPASNTRYGAVHRCGPIAYQNRPQDQKDKLFCPHCDEFQCRVADNLRIAGATEIPAPVYSDWTFFNNLEGAITNAQNDGLPIFRKQVRKSFHRVPAGITSCTIQNSQLPLPQLHCTDYDVRTVDQATGNGVNAKNQKCGLSFWARCLEDVPFLPPYKSKHPKVHEYDVNLELIPFNNGSIFVSPTPTPTVCPEEVCGFSDTTNVTRNNLGGMCGGPVGMFMPPECGDGAPQEIKYEFDTDLFLVIENTSDYFAAIGMGGDPNTFGNRNNGLSFDGMGEFGQINLRGESSLGLTFKFENGAGDPVMMPNLKFQFYDFDQQGCTCTSCACTNCFRMGIPMFPPSTREIIRIPKTEIPDTNDITFFPTTNNDTNFGPDEGGRGEQNSNVCFDDTDPDDFVFSSIVQGNGADNPEFPSNLDQLQRSKSIVIEFDNVEQFTAEFELLGGNAEAAQGRNFLFKFNYTPPCNFP